MYRNRTYRLIAFDLDGTLLNHGGQISQATMAVLSKIRKKGIPMAIASGRLYPGAIIFARDVSPETPVISINGAYIRGPQGVVFREAIPVERCIDALEFLHDRGVYFHINLEDLVIASAMEHGALYYHNLNATLAEEDRLVIEVPDDPIARIRSLEGGILKCIAMDNDPEILRNARGIFENRGFSITSSWSDNFEVMAPGVTKGLGLERLCRYLDIPIEQTVAFGDNSNDIEFIQSAGLGIAMANAGEEVKAVSDLVGGHHDEDGVAHMLMELFGDQL